MKKISLLLLALSTICLTGCSFTQQHEKDKFSKISECKKIEEGYANEYGDGGWIITYQVYYSDKIDYCLLEKTNFDKLQPISSSLSSLATNKEVISTNYICASSSDFSCKPENDNYENVKAQYIPDYKSK